MPKADNPMSEDKLRPPDGLSDYREFERVINELSQKYAEKTKRLDESKDEYSRKLKEISELVKMFKGGVEIGDTDQVRHNELKLNKDLNGLWKDAEGTSYLVVPVVERTEVESGDSEQDSSTEPSTDPAPVYKAEQIPAPQDGKKIKPQKKKKKTCSYCHGSGHNRASCEKRLLS